jgi:importin subunit beta-1
VSQVANTAAQIIAKIAIIEVPRGQWTDLIGALLSNMTNPQATSSLKKATLDTFGFICEEIVCVLFPFLHCFFIITVSLFL